MEASGIQPESIWLKLAAIPDVRYGSQADIANYSGHVRFTTQSGHHSDIEAKFLFVELLQCKVHRCAGNFDEPGNGLIHFGNQIDRTSH